MAGACVHPVRKRYARDFECHARTTRIVKHDSSGFLVTGCAGEVRYACVPGWQPPGRVRPCPVERADAKTVELERLGRVQRVAAEGGPQVVLDLVLDATARLSMRAAPARTPGEVEATLTDKRGAQLDEPCPLLFVLDGQPGAPPAPQSSADKLTRTWQLRVSSELLRDMNRAQVLALRACEQRWTLAREQRELLAQFAEELAVIGAVPAPRER